MLNEELIAKLPLDVINEMPYNDLARLTKYFAEEQVRAILAKSNDIEAQRLIFEGIKKKYEQWDGEKYPFGVNLRIINKNMFGVDTKPQFPEYFDKIDLSLKYGFVIGINKIFPTSYVSPSVTRKPIAETNNPKTPDTSKLEARIKELEVELKSHDNKIIEMAAELEKEKAENKALKEQLEEERQKHQDFIDDFSDLDEFKKMNLHQKIVFFMTVTSVLLDKRFTNMRNLASFIATMCNEKPTTIGPMLSRIGQITDENPNPQLSVTLHSAAQCVSDMLKQILTDETKHDKAQIINKIRENLLLNYPLPEDE